LNVKVDTTDRFLSTDGGLSLIIRAHDNAVGVQFHGPDGTLSLELGLTVESARDVARILMRAKQSTPTMEDEWVDLITVTTLAGRSYGFGVSVPPCCGAEKLTLRIMDDLGGAVFTVDRLPCDVVTAARWLARLAEVSLWRSLRGRDSSLPPSLIAAGWADPLRSL
jgi:hypothetical protein